MRSRPSCYFIGSGLAVFIVMWLLISVSPLPALELELLRWITGIRTNALNTAAVWITNAGSLNVLVPLAVLSSAVLFLRKQWTLGMLFLTTVFWYPALLPIRILAGREAPKAELRSPTKGVVYIVEAPIERAGQRQAAAAAAAAKQPTAPRPAASWYELLLQLLYRGLTRSFPSNHAAASGYLFGLCLLLSWRRGCRSLAGVFALLILGIGLSRVYMGVHYPSDVLASWGLALAALGAGAIILHFDSFKWRNAGGNSDRNK